MAPEHGYDDDESQPLTEETYVSSSPLADPRKMSTSSASTTSLIFEHMAGNGYTKKPEKPYRDNDSDDDGGAHDKYKDEFQEMDIEEADFSLVKGVDRRYKFWLWACSAVCVVGWAAAFFLFISNGSYIHRSTHEHDPEATSVVGHGKKITIDQLQSGQWNPAAQYISWINGANGEDGLVLEKDAFGTNDYLTVEDVRDWGDDGSKSRSRITLMKDRMFSVNGSSVAPVRVWPSPDLKVVLCMSDYKHNWRHSSTGLYWLFDVESQTGQPLDPSNRTGRIQLATWSPTSKAVVFTRDNNMYLRNLGSDEILPITEDGGEERFNGVPDWVYEEEVFSGPSATWWSPEGKYIAFLATNETGVPEYPVQYFISRPSGTRPPEGLENYPEVRQIKYPKAGAPNPKVQLRFYDVESSSTFEVSIEGDFEDLDKLITEVVWGGDGKVLVRQTNRESDVLKMVLIDVKDRKGKVVRERDVQKLDGGWFEISETTVFVPADPSKNREHDGYIDTVIHEGYDHLAYFTPLDNPEPIMLTSGKWEVEDAPSAVDLKNNIVYFVGTRESSIQRHIYKVTLDGSGLDALTDISKDGYYSASFSKGAGYALLSYHGPKVPWQKVISTPSSPGHFDYLIEDNKQLARMASRHELPLKVYDTVNIDGYDLNVVERRPPHFDKRKKYPVLFYLYGGPGSQMVNKKFQVDFQSYVAGNLGYIVVTVDGRGTGLIGRKARCIVRGNIGYWEAHDQIATAKIWAQKKYVDESRMAIWGWSYGGYMTLKTLEQDAGQTFKYGMAVAPVTDWQFYDSIYTERYMHTPQHNPEGYQNASVSNVTAIAQNVRWLIMHGVADDNVHFQNTLTLLDAFDGKGIENYDVHVFPDSDHSIYFNNANRIVYDKLSWWLVNAFNGEWERIQKPVPLRAGQQVGTSDGRARMK